MASQLQAGDSPVAQEMRSFARQLFLDVLRETSIEKAFDQHIECSRQTLRVAEDLYDLAAYSRVLVLAMGKAGHTMAEALATRVGAGLSGIVATSVEDAAQLPGFRYFRGGHPLPTRESLRAASAMLQTLATLSPGALVLYLISGGSSAIVEKPVDDDIALDHLVATYRALVHCGASIAEINAIRKHLSAIKGGRLARAAAVAQQVSIMVSDVPEPALDALASGPTMPDSTTVEDCYRIAAEYALLKEFPAPVRELFDRRALEETPKKDEYYFRRSRWWPILSNSSLFKPAAAGASLGGFAVEIDNSTDDWDYRRAADTLLGRLRALRRGVSRACLIAGGEVSVKVTDGGRGGRNQQFALYCAQQIVGENISVLSAGTDGIDGNSPAAGAVVDGTTVARARALGLDPEQAAARFDAFPLFEALGDAVVTGATGNNLRDLRFLLAY